MNRPKLVAASAVFLGTVSLSAYGAFLDTSEIVHFWAPVPAGRIDRPRMMHAAGRPIRLRPISIDLDRRGILKRWAQPGVEALSTHWILNVGTTPVRLRLEMVEGGVPVSWKVNSNFGFDERTHTFAEPLMPGQSIPNLAVDWVFTLPPATAAGSASRLCDRVIYSGGLRLLDADSGRLLTFIPITIGRGLTSAVEPRTCDLCPLKPGALSRPTSGDTSRSPAE
jgi:hypothetical protein